MESSILKAGRPRSCDCGACPKCKHREYMLGWYQRQSKEKRQEMVAARDPEKVRASDNARYYRHRDARIARAAEYAKLHTEEATEAKRRCDERNPEKRKARSAVSNALRDGRLTKGPCEQLDGECRGKVHGHHEDYSKPLDVTWLCSFHHGVRHRTAHASRR